LRILVAPEAAQDLREAYEHIAKDNLSAADQVLARLVEVIGLLAARVFEGRKVTLRTGRKCTPGLSHRIDCTIG
jgi:plasmid stabilization system protein ParE